MSEPNLFISNGTCYYAPGQQANDAMIPCGNDFYGTLTCCQQGDMCLTSHACYNDEFGVTYLAGCSDPNYQDVNCPDKGSFDDEPWVGLVYCNGTSNEWTACRQPDSSDTLASADHCWCPEEPRTAAFTAAKTLDPRVRLGSSLGESVIWQPGHVPTKPPSDDDDIEDGTTATPVPTPTSNAPSSPAETPSPTSTAFKTSPANEGAADTASGLDQPARIGIGIGVGVGSALVLLVAGLVFFLRRRRKPRDEKNADESQAVDSLPPPPSTLGPPELDSRAARPWSMRSELPNTPRSIPAEMESPVQVGIHDDKPSHARHGYTPQLTFKGKPHDGSIAELP